jgi:hypothetical protein
MLDYVIFLSELRMDRFSIDRMKQAYKHIEFAVLFSPLLNLSQIKFLAPYNISL